MAAVASVEPSSAISISQSVQVWARTEAMVASRVAAASKAGVMTETAGVMGGRNGKISHAKLRLTYESIWIHNH